MSSQRYERVSGLRYQTITNALYITGKAEADSSLVQVSANDQDDASENSPRTRNPEPAPSSPPPSFRSRASSPSSRHLLSSDPIASEAERTLADTFDDGSDSDPDDGNNVGDDRQRLMRANTAHSETEHKIIHDGDRPNLSRDATHFPMAVTPATSIPARPYTGSAPFSSFSHNDGVFANLNAKPERGEKLEEQPPVNLLFTIILQLSY